MKTILIANQKGGCGKSSVAITLASALANRGGIVALADADPQKSSLRWLKQRSEHAIKIVNIDWRKDEDIGTLPKKAVKSLGADGIKNGWLIIDAAGSLSLDKASSLISEADTIIIPVLPSIFDIDSSKKFLKSIKEIKRIRKGKVTIHLVANRVNTSTHNSQKLLDFFQDIGQLPVTWIGERSVYPQLAEQGLALFDMSQKKFCDVQLQWIPLIKELAPEIAFAYKEQLYDTKLTETFIKLSAYTSSAHTQSPKSSNPNKKSHENSATWYE